MKLCIIYNFAAHYRTSVFVELDREYACDWFFGKKQEDIRKMDYRLLQGKVTEVEACSWHGLEYQKGIQKLLFRDYDIFLMSGLTRSLSMWLFIIRARLFHPKKKVYLWTHGFYGKESKPLALIKRLMFNLPTGGNFTYGNHARELMLREGIPAEKIFVIHNSLDYEKQLELRQSGLASDVYREHFRNADPTLVFIGRLTAVKQLDLLIGALALLVERRQPCNLVLIGDGTERKSLEARTAASGLQDRVWFYGACYDEKTNAALIYNADLCVSPGNVGLTAMHAMVYGTPVVSHDDFAWQMPEFEAIRPGRTGDFYRHGDVAALADTIQQWFETHADRESVRQACCAEIDAYWTPDFQLNVLKKHLKR